MANIFENILKVPGNILKGVGDVHESMSEGARQRLYGVDYKQNREIKRKQADAGLKTAEANQGYYKARQAYYENLRNNPAFTVDSLSKVTADLQEKRYALNAVIESEEATPEQKDIARAEIAKIDDLDARVIDAYNAILPGGEATGAQTGQPPPAVGGPGALGGMVAEEEDFVGPMQQFGPFGSAKFQPGEFAPPQPVATAPQPPRRMESPDIGVYGPADAFATGQLGGPGPGALGNITPPAAKAKPKPGAPVVTDEIGYYTPKLDAESQTELEQIISGGNQNEINMALQRLRDKYGPVR